MKKAPIELINSLKQKARLYSQAKFHFLRITEGLALDRHSHLSLVHRKRLNLH